LGNILAMFFISASSNQLFEVGSPVPSRCRKISDEIKN
jgi:hypothetical protein